MEANSVSMLWYRRSKPQGKMKRRVQDLHILSSYHDFRASRPTLDLSHNESVRLAADSLLSRGLGGYHEVLNEEGEVDFLSEPEKVYILENGRDGSKVDPGASDDDDDDDKELESLSAGSQCATQRPTLSTDSDLTVEGLDLSSLKDVTKTDRVQDESIVEAYFQSDSRAAGMKDLVREFIRKATMALAIVMDSFSDVELLCDLLEASRKRNVSVHLLLDHLNLNLFVSMWQDLKLNSKNFPKLSVCSVDGRTYCAKTGRKLTGQIAESFIIADWTEVLTGSYSFSWLSWQVHRSLAVLLKGSAVTPFHQEFHRLHSSSKPVPGFVTYITVPHTLPLSNTLHAAQNSNADVSEPKSSQAKSHRTSNEDAQNTQTKAKMPILSNPQSPELEHSKVMTEPLHRAGTATQIHEQPPQLYPKPQVQPGPLQSVSVGKPKHKAQAVCTQHGAQSKVEPLEKNQNQIQSHSNPLSQTHVSYIQSQLTSLTVTTKAEHNMRVQESNPRHTVSPAHDQHRTVRYQSPFKTDSNLEHHNEVTEGHFFQQRNRDRLVQPLRIPAAPNTQRRQWYCSLNFKTKVDFLCDHPKVLSPSTSQQTQAKAGLMFPITHPRGHISGFQTKASSQGTRRQDEPQRHHQPPLQSHPAAEAPGSQSAPTTHLKSQLQSELHLQPHASQQARPPPRLNWMPQGHGARSRPVARHSSFGPAYGMGQQAGWRPFHSSMNMSLGRSKSMTDGRSAGFKGARLNPNITKT